MSSTLRQSNIFGRYDWKMAYDSFLNADYESYDYKTIYQSMVAYIKREYPEDFNDFIQHSELLAHVNMLAFLGQGYALRNDNNTKENFIDEAERRQSIIHIARTLNYRPKRNIAAQGQLKVVSVSTTEKIYNSNGDNISNQKIFWNEKGNHSWYDSFIKIIESAFTDDNKFGHPTTQYRGDKERIELYDLKQKRQDYYVYPFTENINGVNYRFEVVPTSMEEGKLFERFPSNENVFNIVYRNDNTGNSSPTTGFFVNFKQGQLLNRDFYYDVPKTDRSELIDIPNINDSDVWVQEIDENNDVKHYWYDIPKGTGQNIVYSSSQLDERRLYFSKSQHDDRVELLYGDGNFSIAPTKRMRVWVRQSSNTQYSILAGDFHEKEVVIPYIDSYNRTQKLTVYLTNPTTINNSKVSEPIKEIKKNAISNYFNQDRMVSIEDYNIFPFERNPLRKIKVINRDNTGKGRYPHLDTHDPTGMHSNLNISAVDGYIFEEYYPTKSSLVTDNLYINKDTLPHLVIEDMIKNHFFRTFYNNIMFVDNFKRSRNDYTLEYDYPRLFWQNEFIGKTSRKGSINYKTFNDNGFDQWERMDVNSLTQIREYSKLLFLHNNEQYWTTVIGYDRDNNLIVSDYIPSNAHLSMVFPNVPWTLSEGIKKKLTQLVDKEESFGIRYDDVKGKWSLINQDNILDSTSLYENVPPDSNTQPDNRWLIKGTFVREDDGNYYAIETRGLRLCMGSDKQIRFFFNNTDYVSDMVTGFPVIDHVTVKQDDETFGVSSLKPEYDKYVTNKNITIEYLD